MAKRVYLSGVRGTSIGLPCHGRENKAVSKGESGWRERDLEEVKKVG